MRSYLPARSSLYLFWYLQVPCLMLVRRVTTSTKKIVRAAKEDGTR